VNRGAIRRDRLSLVERHRVVQAARLQQLAQPDDQLRPGTGRVPSITYAGSYTTIGATPRSGRAAAASSTSTRQMSGMTAREAPA
jgi:hypothetical protein